jgi:hypothetical protein
VVSGYPASGTNLVDILDRVLDKGLVVAGDIKISLANVELLTIKIRLLVCSIDKAEQIGLNWWRYDESLVYRPEAALPGAMPAAVPAAVPIATHVADVARLEARIAELEQQLMDQRQEAARATRRRGTPPAGGGRGSARPAAQRRRTE